jgi:hypothetical protein
MRVAIYARVSTESQEARGTIGSQLEVLRKRVAAEGHELVAEYCDDGLGRSVDWPGLDTLRDAAKPADAVCVFQIGWPGCLSGHRVDELVRHGCRCCSTTRPRSTTTLRPFAHAGTG